MNLVSLFFFLFLPNPLLLRCVYAYAMLENAGHTSYILYIYIYIYINY